MRKILAVLIALLGLFSAGCLRELEGYIVAGQSMYPMIKMADRVIVDRSAYAQARPERGDILLLQLPGDREPSIRRLIGLPGETIEIRQGIVYINGQPLDEPYAHDSNASINRSSTLVLDEYFVLGDNRPNSRDSRSYGPIRPGNPGEGRWRHCLGGVTRYEGHV